jgi:hypothetical protein
MKQYIYISFLTILLSFIVLPIYGVHHDIIVGSTKDSIICEQPDTLPYFSKKGVEYSEYVIKQFMKKAKKIYPFHIMMSFVVEKNGRVSNITIKTPIQSRYCSRFRKIINNMGKWKPGLKDGKTVRCRVYFNAYLH